MTYRMLDDGSVYDGPHCLGKVLSGPPGEFYVLIPARVIATLPTQEDAVEWLVCEHRDIPWVDRPEAQRIAANAST